MATKKKSAKKQTPKVPYCGCCGGANVTTVAWIGWRDDGTERPTFYESPISGDEGNWCSDCDAEDRDGHVEIVYPEAMSGGEASRRRRRNTAAREHGPELLCAVLAIVAAAKFGPVTADSIELATARELAEKLTG
jgi:hypothetical protein